MPSSKLGAASHLILGLLALEGPRTSYELNDLIDVSVGNFWHIPRSQLYAAPRRLVELGLVSEEQEETGRRRRTFTITDDGLDAVRGWIESPSGVPELRDAAMLRLFFADLVEPQSMLRLADEQIELHQRQLETYERVEAEGRAEPFWGAALTLRMGLHHERAHVAFWAELRDRLIAEAQAIGAESAAGTATSTGTEPAPRGETAPDPEETEIE